VSKVSFLNPILANFFYSFLLYETLSFWGQYLTLLTLSLFLIFCFLFSVFFVFSVYLKSVKSVIFEPRFNKLFFFVPFIRDFVFLGSIFDTFDTFAFSYFLFFIFCFFCFFCLFIIELYSIVFFTHNKGRVYIKVYIYTSLTIYKNYI
jgi:hypothetical protein